MVLPTAEQLVCTHKYKDGSRCSAAPVFGAQQCEKHKGRPDKKMLAKRERYADRLVGRCEALIRRGPGREDRNEEIIMDILSMPRQVDPGVLLLEEIARTAGVVAWLERKVQSLREDDQFVADVTVTTHEEGASATGNHVDTTRTETRKEISHWWDLLTRERDHLVRITTAALRAGVEERAVRLAERSVDSLEAALSSALTQLGHDPNSAAVRAVVGNALQKALMTADADDDRMLVVPGELYEPSSVHEEPVRQVDF